MNYMFSSGSIFTIKHRTNEVQADASASYIYIIYIPKIEQQITSLLIGKSLYNLFQFLV